MKKKYVILRSIEFWVDFLFFFPPWPSILSLVETVLDQIPNGEDGDLKN